MTGRVEWDAPWSASARASVRVVRGRAAEEEAGWRAAEGAEAVAGEAVEEAGVVEAAGAEEVVAAPAPVRARR
ncbi:hypothetical protein AMK10_32550 [Streptomyces sp. CB02058]|nr:hypothetical protein AMK10_32550 [Streptomyces sp. CB02058]